MYGQRTLREGRIRKITIPLLAKLPTSNGVGIFG